MIYNYYEIMARNDYECLKKHLPEYIRNKYIGNGTTQITLNQEINNVLITHSIQVETATRIVVP